MQPAMRRTHKVKVTQKAFKQWPPEPGDCASGCFGGGAHNKNNISIKQNIHYARV